jgi:hypothetical protein
MTPSRKTPVKSSFNPSSAVDVDVLLTRFFRSAMPEPWPACPRVLPEAAALLPRRKSTKGRWLLRAGRRLAAAAVVAGMVVGYVAMQAWFVDPQPAFPSLMDGRPEMGFNKLVPGKVIDNPKKDEPGDDGSKKDIP